MKINQKFSREDFEFKILTKEHLRYIKEFKSYEKELVNFLNEDALDNQEKRISLTYLWFHKESNKLAGYITLLTDSIKLNKELKDKFREKNINYKSLPALKIGRICVDDSFLKRGLGKLMIDFAISIVLRLNSTVGCRFITLDAKRNIKKDRDSLHFYKKLEFKILRERKKGTVPMYIDLFQYIKAIKNGLI